MEIQQAELMETYNLLLEILGRQINDCFEVREIDNVDKVKEKIINKIDLKIQKGLSHKELEYELYTDFMINHDFAIFYALVIHHYLAKRDIVGSEALKLLCKANFILGFEDGRYYEGGNPRIPIKQQNREQVRSAIRTKLKIIELLYEKRKKSCWASIADARAAIRKDVSHFIANDPGNVLAKHTVQDNIRQWSKNDLLVAEAFEKAIIQDE